MRESSEVLARKYRPSNFDELIGQETISQTLSLALDSNRLSHAYLFSGLRGSGKTSTARIFAKALLCEEGMSHQPCGKCANCTMAIENRHIDIVEMDGASSRKIDDIRDLIEQTKYKPASARYKIFIIDEVHMLTKEAFNALLKTLEEPPSYVKFILATTDPLKLPATILSRTQHFRFKSIALNKIIDHLAHILDLEGVKYEKNALEIIARSGGGSLRDSLTLLDQAIIFSKNFVDVKTVTDMLGLVDPDFIAQIFQAVFAKDYAKIVAFTKILEDYEAEMVVDELIAYLKEKMFNQDALFSTLVLDRFFRVLSESKYLFSINADGSFVLSMVFFKMVEALRIKEIDQMIESMHKDIPRADIETKTIQKIQITQETPHIAEPHKEEIVKEEVSTAEVIDEHLATFKELNLKIRDRNYELSQAFERSISYISFKDNSLTWESCANPEDKKSLTYGYSVIKQLVREIFGFKTKIKHKPCSKEIVAPAHKVEEKKKPSSEYIEPELNPSCLTTSNQEPTQQEQLTPQPTNILEDKMVVKAIEMFEATKVIVQSKI